MLTTLIGPGVFSTSSLRAVKKSAALAESDVLLLRQPELGRKPAAFAEADTAPPPPRRKARAFAADAAADLAPRGHGSDPTSAAGGDLSDLDDVELRARALEEW